VPQLTYSLLTGVSGSLRFECFAIAQDAVGFFDVWIRPRAIAAVTSVQRLRMSAKANFVALHITPRGESMRAGVGSNRVFALLLL
jgi:hypothetical protein